MPCIAQPLTEDAEIRMGESADVWKDSRQIGGADAEPSRERGRKLVDRRRGNPAALAGIVGAVDGESRESAEQSPALDRAAENELMASPPVIRTGAVRWIGAAEIGGGERGHLRRDSELDGRVVKCV